MLIYNIYNEILTFCEEQGQGAKMRGMYMATKCEVVDEQDKQTDPRNALKVRCWDTPALSYKELLANVKKGQRKGNWRKLNRLDKALYRASLWYTKHLGSIVNETLVETLLEFVARLKETKGTRIFERGLKKAVKMLTNREADLFAWAPQLKLWLKDPDYIFWLGTMR